MNSHTRIKNLLKKQPVELLLRSWLFLAFRIKKKFRSDPSNLPILTEKQIIQAYMCLFLPVFIHVLYHHLLLPPLHRSSSPSELDSSELESLTRSLSYSSQKPSSSLWRIQNALSFSIYLISLRRLLPSTTSGATLAKCCLRLLTQGIFGVQIHR